MIQNPHYEPPKYFKYLYYRVVYDKTRRATGLYTVGEHTLWGSTTDGAMHTIDIVLDNDASNYRYTFMLYLQQDTNYTLSPYNGYNIVFKINDNKLTIIKNDKGSNMKIIRVTALLTVFL